MRGHPAPPSEVLKKTNSKLNCDLVDGPILRRRRDISKRIPNTFSGCNDLTQSRKKARLFVSEITECYDPVHLATGSPDEEEQ